MKLIYSVSIEYEVKASSSKDAAQAFTDMLRDPQAKPHLCIDAQPIMDLNGNRVRCNASIGYSYPAEGEEIQ